MPGAGRVCAERMDSVSRQQVECISEVVPLLFLRELQVVVDPTASDLSLEEEDEEELREAVAPLVLNPDKCVVTVVQKGDGW